MDILMMVFLAAAFAGTIGYVEFCVRVTGPDKRTSDCPR
jgi:hypothetical protein